ncbi:MAG: AMP-binding protein, partial [Sphingomonadaceae bacterium]|nr:AMP-binding protein [Sphingomonadaceae bacterium]
GTGYGMTETAGSVAMAVGEDWMRNRAAAGRVLSLVDVRIEDEQGNVLPVGQAGEIVVRGAQVMLGYWDMPDETAAVLGADGWLRTGDVGVLDEEGYLLIVDRKKDMVISGGENIYCAEVERVLSEIPEVSECATFGIPDERLGELLVAVVRASGITADAVKLHVGERLARYKAPGHVVFTDQPLPRNHLDKVDKIALRGRWPELAKEIA